MRLLRLLRCAPVSFLFTISFVAVCALYDYGRVVQLRPQPHHIWRQTDCLSLTYNYYDDVGGFWEPSIHNLFSYDLTSGRTAGEFPGYYYLVGQIWKVTGPSEPVYRAIGILLHFFGSLALCLTVFLLVRSRFWAIWVTLLFFTSPAIVYFAPSFLTDVPAWDLVLIGIYFLVRHKKRGRNVDLGLAFTSFTLGMLLKVTAGMLPLALLGVLVWETAFMRDQAKRKLIFPKRVMAWVAYGICFTLVLVWYRYVESYNQLHGGRYTFNGFWPVWEVDSEKFDRIFEFAQTILVYQIFDTTVWLMLGVMLIYLLRRFRSVPIQAKLTLGTLVIGCATYVVLWFQALDNHDYYFINPLILPLCIVGVFLWVLMTCDQERLLNWSTKAAFALILIYNLVYAYGNQRMRYWNTPDAENAPLLPIHTDADITQWSHTAHYGLNDLLTIQDQLRQMGITPEDLVIVPNDGTINASLYLMGQRGWTGFSNRLSDESSMETIIGKGAKYLIDLNGHMEGEDHLTKFAGKQVGQYGLTRVFELKKPDQWGREQN